jgi:DNA-binding CsgD family transcriptional regulator
LRPNPPTSHKVIRSADAQLERRAYLVHGAGALPNTGTRSVTLADDELATWRTAIDALTARQRQTLALLAAGLHSYEIADRLGISEATVKTHVSHIYRRLGVSNRVEATTRYLRTSTSGQV